MKFMDRFRKKEKPPVHLERPGLDPDTFGLLLFGGIIRADDVAEAASKVYGSNAVCSVDDSRPAMPSLDLELDGVRFTCDCMPMPQPKEICDFSQISGGLFSDEEMDEILKHKSFLVLVQKGGSGNLDEKRNICRLFVRLAAELMQREDALGVYINSANLMISRRAYLNYAAVLENNIDDPEYFPSPLWIGIVHAYSKDTPVISTIGLKQFGFYELAFVKPQEEWPEIHQRLYLMSIFQITEKELYQNMDTIEFTQGNLSVFKEQDGILYIIG